MPTKKKHNRKQLARFTTRLTTEITTHHALMSASFDGDPKPIPVMDVAVEDGEPVIIRITLEKHLSDSDVKTIGTYALGFAVGIAPKALHHRFVVEVYYQDAKEAQFAKKHEPR